MSESIGDAEGDYAEGTPLVDLFGDGARARILSVFATRRSREFTVTELAQQAGITRKTAYDHLDDFVEMDVVESREAGRGKRYTTAENSAIATKLYELSGVTLRRRQEMREDAEVPEDGE